MISCFQQMGCCAHSAIVSQARCPLHKLSPRGSPLPGCPRSIGGVKSTNDEAGSKTKFMALLFRSAALLCYRVIRPFGFGASSGT